MTGSIRGAEHFLPIALAWGHVTLSEVAHIESWRQKLTDRQLFLGGDYYAGLVGISPEQLAAYLRRNRRPIGEAA